ncbi:MAG: T9SS type A sorting domain-containing protein, partial [Candidatus Latescibacterota bacterium]
AGDGDVFIAKNNTEGDYVWSHICGDTLFDSGNGVTLDSAGHVFLTGSFVGTLDLGGPPLMASDAFDVFVARFDADGNHVWSRVYGGPQNELAHAITTDDAGNVLATGAFILTADFGGGLITSAGGFDVYLASYDPNGAHIWSRSYGGPSFDSPDGIVVDGAGDILLAGSFDTAIGTTMLAKLDPGGNVLWGKEPGATAGAVGRSVDVDDSDNVLLIGTFLGDMSLGGDTMSTVLSSDVFLAKFDGSGGHLWSQQFVGGPPPGGDHASGVAADADGNVLATGWFEGTADFGAGPVVSIAPGGDLFIAKYHGTMPTAVITPQVGVISGLRSRPNPFNPSTHIEFNLELDVPVTLQIHDVHGELVRTLASRRFTRGPQMVSWDGLNERGQSVASGVYFLRVTAGNRTLTKKMVLLE